MKPPFRFSVSFNGFTLGYNTGKSPMTGLKWCIRKGREYQRLCQNVPLQVEVHVRHVTTEHPKYPKSGYTGAEPVYTATLKPRR
jgi:hypothetical protein